MTFVALASIVWAAPFAVVGIHLMYRASKDNQLGIARFLGITLGTGLLLLVVGAPAFLLIFSGQPGPDAGLALSVGLAFSAIGAVSVWAVTALLAFAVLRSHG